MKYDYSFVCNCGKEIYAEKISEIKEEIKLHSAPGICKSPQGHGGYIDRHFAGGDIDDSFPNHRVGNPR